MSNKYPHESIRKINNWIDAITNEDGETMSIGSLITLKMISDELLTIAIPIDAATVPIEGKEEAALLETLESIMNEQGDWNDKKQAARNLIRIIKYPHIKGSITAAPTNEVKSEYQLCPKCSGTGRAPNYDLVMPSIIDICDVCKGDKIIPRPEVHSDAVEGDKGDREGETFGEFWSKQKFSFTNDNPKPIDPS